MWSKRRYNKLAITNCRNKFSKKARDFVSICVFQLLPRRGNFCENKCSKLFRCLHKNFSFLFAQMWLKFKGCSNCTRHTWQCRKLHTCRNSLFTFLTRVLLSSLSLSLLLFTPQSVCISFSSNSLLWYFYWTMRKNGHWINAGGIFFLYSRVKKARNFSWIFLS